MPLSLGETIELPPDVAHHIHVLRLAADESFTLFNGEGGEYTARLAGAEKKRAHAEILSFSAREAELPFALTIAQALPESSKMDWIVEKAIELGAAAIQPILSQRCVVRLSGERAEKRLAHWQKIIVAASEQCGRNRLAHLHDLADFKNWISQPAQKTRLLLSPRASLSLSGWARSNQQQALTLMVGPEGGFTTNEEDLALSKGAQLVSMGPRILRTETAGMSALATLTAIWGI
jgi:16S rRNA (uracil1498-N3)-methyltransferase